MIQSPRRGAKIELGEVAPVREERTAYRQSRVCRRGAGQRYANRTRIRAVTRRFSPNRSTRARSGVWTTVDRGMCPSDERVGRPAHRRNRDVMGVSAVGPVALEGRADAGAGARAGGRNSGGRSEGAGSTSRPFVESVGGIAGRDDPRRKTGPGGPWRKDGGQWIQARDADAGDVAPRDSGTVRSGPRRDEHTLGPNSVGCGDQTEARTTGDQATLDRPETRPSAAPTSAGSTSQLTTTLTSRTTNSR